MVKYLLIIRNALESAFWEEYPNKLPSYDAPVKSRAFLPVGNIFHKKTALTDGTYQSWLPDTARTFLFGF
jgi:hypothetical protein